MQTGRSVGASVAKLTSNVFFSGNSTLKRLPLAVDSAAAAGTRDEPAAACYQLFSYQTNF